MAKYNSNLSYNPSMTKKPEVEPSLPEEVVSIPNEQDTYDEQWCAESEELDDEESNRQLNMQHLRTALNSIDINTSTGSLDYHSDRVMTTAVSWAATSNDINVHGKTTHDLFKSLVRIAISTVMVEQETQFDIDIYSDIRMIAQWYIGVHTSLLSSDTNFFDRVFNEAATELGIDDATSIYERLYDIIFTESN